MRYVWMLAVSCMVVSCFEPIASDFEQNVEALQENEIKWISRIQRTTDLHGYTGASEADVEAASTFGVAAFEQVIPLILEDLQQGNLQGYSPDVEGKTVSVAELTERLTSFGSSWQDISPMLAVFHLKERGYSQNGEFKANQTELELVWYDQEGNLPEKKVTLVKVADLDYNIKVDVNVFSFQEYLAARRYYFFPIWVVSKSHDLGGLQTMDQAFFLKEKVLSGQWDQISWIDQEMNLSGKRPIELGIDNLQPKTGLYEFDAAEFTDLLSIDMPDSVQLYITINQDKLEGEWSWRRRKKDILYPSGKNDFFSVSGEEYIWTEKDERILGVTFYNGKKVVGNRIAK